MPGTANTTTSGLSSDQPEPITAAIISLVSASDDVTHSAVPSTSSSGSAECRSLNEEQITELEIISLSMENIKPCPKLMLKNLKEVVDSREPKC